MQRPRRRGGYASPRGTACRRSPTAWARPMRRGRPRARRPDCAPTWAWARRPPWSCACPKSVVASSWVRRRPPRPKSFRLQPPAPAPAAPARPRRLSALLPGSCGGRMKKGGRRREEAAECASCCCKNAREARAGGWERVGKAFHGCGHRPHASMLGSGAALYWRHVSRTYVMLTRHHRDLLNTHMFVFTESRKEDGWGAWG